METTNDNGAPAATGEEIVITEEDIGEVPQLPQAKDGETIDWEGVAKQYMGIATRRGTKLTKLKTAPKVAPPAPAPTPALATAPATTKPGELGLAERAYLIATGIKD